MNLSAASLFGQILFGAIGTGAFIYGKKQSSYKAMLIALTLMIYPFFVSETWMLYAIGGGLTAGLFIFRD